MCAVQSNTQCSALCGNKSERKAANRRLGAQVSTQSWKIMRFNALYNFNNFLNLAVPKGLTYFSPAYRVEAVADSTARRSRRNAPRCDARWRRALAAKRVTRGLPRHQSVPSTLPSVG